LCELAIEKQGEIIFYPERKKRSGKESTRGSQSTEALGTGTMSQSINDYESSDEECEPRVADRFIRFGMFKDQKVSEICRTKRGRVWLRWASSTCDRIDALTAKAIDEQLKAYDVYKKTKH